MRDYMKMTATRAKESENISFHLVVAVSQRDEAAKSVFLTQKSL